MLRIIVTILVLALILYGASLLSDRHDARAPADPYPVSGEQHPFAASMADVINARPFNPASDGQSRPAPTTPFVEASNTIAHTATVNFQGVDLQIALEATAEVPEAALAVLMETLQIVEVSREEVQSLPFYTSEPGPLRAGAPEVRLPVLDFGQQTNLGAAALSANASVVAPPAQNRFFILTWPDGWVMERPYVIRLHPSFFLDSDGGGSGGHHDDVDLGLPDDDVAAATAALTGPFSQVNGVLTCDPPGGPAEPIPFVTIDVHGSTATTDATGAFSVTASLPEVNWLVVTFDGRIAPVGGAARGPRISVMNDFHNPRSERVDITAANDNRVGDVLNVGTLVMTTLDCELYNHGREALESFHFMTGGGNPPAPDDLRIKRWEDVHVGAPYAYYSYVVLAANYRANRGYQRRRDTVRHEFGHTIRHAADGGQSHWDWDNFRWVYARAHDGTEVFNEHYAFNEGFAQYWECTIGDDTLTTTRTTSAGTTWCHAARVPRPLPPGSSNWIDYLDWNEFLVAERIFAMSQEPGVGHAAIVTLLNANPGSIHTLMEFEQAYCRTFTGTTFCTGGAPVRTKPDCPPGFNNDGATCRETNHILAKDSYTRGVGTVPIGCGTRENDAGLCYNQCIDGFDGVGPVCWEQCDDGMNDDGAFCRRDVEIIASDNSMCPWWDVCGLVTERGCSVCPAGYQNDGCTCRIDAWIFAKNTYGRGAGEIPTDCGPGREYDAGLCYQPCAATFNGVGPVCWGTCPPGYDDHGATCYRPPNILVRL